MYKVLCEPFKHLWQVWDLILNMILPLLPSCWGFSFALGCGVSCFGMIQHSSVHGCSAASCNLGVLEGKMSTRPSTPPDGEALYSQQKQDQELTVAQIMNSLLPDSELN